MRRIADIVILVLAVAGAVYYSANDNETQGVLVVLLGILYFMAVPYIVKT